MHSNRAMNRPENIDKKVINNIKLLGGDLSKERPVEFFLYFPTELQGVRAEVEMMNLQFYTELRFDKKQDYWHLFATKNMVVETERLVSISNWLEALAKKHGGQYDGWGTMV